MSDSSLRKTGKTCTRDEEALKTSYFAMLGELLKGQERFHNMVKKKRIKGSKNQDECCGQVRAQYKKGLRMVKQKDVHLSSFC